MNTEGFRFDKDVLQTLTEFDRSKRMPHAIIIESPDAEKAAELAVFLSMYAVCGENEKPCGVCKNCRNAKNKAHADIAYPQLQAQKKAGAAYFRQNILFWARRISGLAVMVMLCFHLTAFERAGGAAYRLQNFNLFRLISQLLFVLSLAVHVLSNVRPLLISFGIRSLKERSPEILLTLAGILLFFAAAFIVYYLRWVRA